MMLTITISFTTRKDALTQKLFQIQGLDPLISIYFEKYSEQVYYLVVKSLYIAGIAQSISPNITQMQFASIAVLCVLIALRFKSYASQLRYTSKTF